MKLLILLITVFVICVNANIYRKGLIIGINYLDTKNLLHGSINDAHNMHRFLINNNYFRNDELTIMNDYKFGELYPTKANILFQLNELVNFANQHRQEEVKLFLSYSGHGASIPDLNGDEEDGMDELLIPVDYNGYIKETIIDDYLRSEFIDKLHSNVTLSIIIGACHSGTVFDLKYTFTDDYYHDVSDTNTVTNSKCNVVMLSASMDEQTALSARIINENEYQSLHYYSFFNNYNDGITMQELVTNMREWMATIIIVDTNHTVSQVPQLSFGNLNNINDPFLFPIVDD